MKLRNKKTGQILEDVKNIDTSLTTIEIWYLDDGVLRIQREKDYHTFLQNWEDVDDINVTNIPLIKDKKIRKAVRAWADVNTLYEIQYDKDEDCLYSPYGSDRTDTSVSISFDDVNVFDDLEHRRGYTITELCGEE